MQPVARPFLVGRCMFCFFVLVALASPACSSAYEAQPIPTQKSAVTQRQFVALMLTEVLRQPEEYRKNTRDPAANRDAVADYITTVQKNYWTNLRSKTWQQLREEGDALKAQGCDDPLLAMNRAIVYRQLEECFLERKILAEANAAFADTEYSPEWKMLTAREGAFVSALWHNNAGDRERQKFVKSLVQHTAEFVKKNKFEDDRRRVAWFWLDHVIHVNDFRAIFLSVDDLKSLGKPLIANDEIDPWLRSMIRGKYHLELGWAIRTGDVANKVKQEQWAEFGKNLIEAAKYFTEAWTLKPQFPESSALMIPIVAPTGIGGDSKREWFDRAVAAQMDWEPAYDSLITFMLPRWGGSKEELFDFGRECLATQRFDTEVPWKLHDVVRTIHADLDNGDPHSVWKERKYYPHLSLLYEGMLREPWPKEGPRPPFSEAQIKSLAVYLASTVGVDKDTKKIVEKYGNGFDDLLLSQKGFRPQVTKAFPFLMLSNVGEEFDECFKKNVSQGNPAKPIVEELRSLAARCDDPRAEPALSAWRKSFDNELRFQQGEWVPLTFEQPLKWRPSAGSTWIAENPNSIVVHSSILRGGKPFLHSTGYFPPPLEVSMDIEQIETEELDMRVGFYMGDTDRRADKKLPGRFFWCDANRGEMGYGIPREEPSPRKLKLEKVNHLHVYIWKDYHDVYVNGHLDDSQPKEKFMPTGHIMLGWMHWARSSGRARYSNVRVRKITAPSPAESDAAARRQHYARVAADNPSYPDPHMKMAETDSEKRSEEGWKAAIAELSEARKLGSLSPKISLLMGNGNHELRQDQDAIKEWSVGSVDPTLDLACKMALAELLATSTDQTIRDPKRAWKVATELCRATKNQDHRALATLAIVNAEIGDFEAAMSSAEKARKLSNDEEANSKYDKMIEAYKADKKP